MYGKLAPFYAKSPYIFRCRTIRVDKVKYPEVEVKADSFDLWAMKLTKSGYGSIIEIKNLDVKTFMDLVHYQNYLDDYATEFQELNSGR